MISKLAANFVKKGKKTIASRTVRECFVYLKNSKLGPLKSLGWITQNLQPRVRFQAKKVSGKIHKIPVPIPNLDGKKVSLKWLADGAANRKERSLHARIAHEIMDSIKKRSASWKRQEETNRLAIRSRTNLKYLKK